MVSSNVEGSTNLFSSFYVILLTNKRTDAGEKIASLAAVTHRFWFWFSFQTFPVLFCRIHPYVSCYDFTIPVFVSFPAFFCEQLSVFPFSLCQFTCLPTAVLRLLRSQSCFGLLPPCLLLIFSALVFSFAVPLRFHPFLYFI